MKKTFVLFFLFLITISSSFSQGKFILQKGKSHRINFKLINNLIVFPVEINGVKLSFLLDTGVSKPIIFNFLNLSEDLKINQAERIFLRGLGEGESVEALRSRNNIFRIGNAINITQDLYAVFDPTLNFAPRLGVPIHGIIGYDLLKDFVVEVNYSKRFMKLHTPETYKPKNCKNCKTFDLEFFNNKPYINCAIQMNGKKFSAKLLIDCGGSDALWLFEDDAKGISIPEKYFDDFLGRGLSGSVFGKRSRIDKLFFDDFELEGVNVAFPDSSSISYARKFKERNGSVLGEVLKRFNVIFDYGKSKITLKRNRYYSAPFTYNKSGIILEHDGVRVVKEISRGGEIVPFNSKNESVAKTTMVVAGSYRYALAPSFRVVELRLDSPAYRAGLKIGDVVLNINNRHAHLYSLQEVTQLFYAETGKRIKLLIDRKGVQMKFQFKLENIL